MSTNLDNNEFDHTHDEGVTVYPDERFPAPSDSTVTTHDPSVYSVAPPAEHVDSVPVEPDTNEYGVARSTVDEHDDENPVVGEGLSEHRPGESLGEWLRNDLEQTKADLHIGGANKDSS
jgi:hypothetical protein